jgi:hypothetical protein
MARHVTAQPGPPTQSIYCATREAGNPPQPVLRLPSLERLASARQLEQHARQCLLP